MGFLPKHECPLTTGCSGRPAERPAAEPERSANSVPIFGGYLMWSRVLIVLIVAAAACRAADEPEAQHVEGRMVARDGKAEFEFGKWRLYFEGVPTNSAGSRVAFQYPT